jgi:hypothetical protein
MTHITYLCLLVKKLEPLKYWFCVKRKAEDATEEKQHQETKF